MSASLPWWQLEHDRFWSSSTVLRLARKPEIIAVYLFLLGEQAKAGGALPGDPELIRVMAARFELVEGLWERAWAELEPMFPLGSDGLRRNPVQAGKVANVDRVREQARARKEAERARREAAKTDRKTPRKRASKAHSDTPESVTEPVTRDTSVTSRACHADVTRDGPVTGACGSPSPLFESRRSKTSLGVETSPETDEQLEPVAPPAASRAAPRRGGRKPASGPHAEFTRWWEAAWSERRLGAVYEHQGAKDGDAVSWLLKRPGGVEEVKLRAVRLLESPDPWLAQNASLALLRSRWNALAVEVRPQTKQDRNDEAFRSVAARLAAKEVANGCA